MINKLPPGRAEDRQQVDGLSGGDGHRRRFVLGGATSRDTAAGGSMKSASQSKGSSSGNSSGVGGGGGGGGGATGTRGSSTGSVGSKSGSNAPGNAGNSDSGSRPNGGMSGGTGSGGSVRSQPSSGSPGTGGGGGGAAGGVGLGGLSRPSPSGAPPGSASMAQTYSQYRQPPSVAPTSRQVAERLQQAYPDRWGQHSIGEVERAVGQLAQAMPGEADISRYGAGAMRNVGQVGINQVLRNVSPGAMLSGMDTTGTRPATRGLNMPGPNSMGMTGNWADQAYAKQAYDTALRSLDNAIDNKGISPQARNATNFVAAGTRMPRGVETVGAPVSGTQYGYDPSARNTVVDRNNTASLKNQMSQYRSPPGAAPAAALTRDKVDALFGGYDGPLSPRQAEVQSWRMHNPTQRPYDASTSPPGFAKSQDRIVSDAIAPPPSFTRNADAPPHAGTAIPRGVPPPVAQGNPFASMQSTLDSYITDDMVNSARLGNLPSSRSRSVVGATQEVDNWALNQDNRMLYNGTPAPQMASGVAVPQTSPPPPAAEGPYTNPQLVDPHDPSIKYPRQALKTVGNLVFPGAGWAIDKAIGWDIGRINQMTPEAQAEIQSRWAQEQANYRAGDIRDRSSNENPLSYASLARPGYGVPASGSGGGADVEPDPNSPSGVSPGLRRRRIGNPSDPYNYGYGPAFDYFTYE